MKFTLLAATAVLSSFSVAQAQSSSPLKEQKDKVGYSIGVDIGSTLKRQGIEIDPEKVLLGLKDAYTGGKIALSEENRALHRTIKQALDPLDLLNPGKFVD